MAFPILPVTWSLDGTLFNAGDDGSGASRILTVDGWDGSPAGRPQLTPRPTGDGSYRGPNYRSSRGLTLSGYSTVESPDQRQVEIDLLSGLCFGPDDLFPLTRIDSTSSLTLWTELNDEIAVVRMADGLSQKFTLQLVATDPEKYSADNSTVSCGLPVGAAGGIQWDGSGTPATGSEWNGTGTPATGLLYQTDVGTTGFVTLTNDGSAEAPVDITFTSGANVLINPTATRIDTAQKITFRETMDANSTVHINTGSGEVTLNGSNRGGSLSRDSMFKVPAHSSIQVAFSADAASATAQMSCTNANVYI
jgi:tail protein